MKEYRSRQSEHIDILDTSIGRIYLFFSSTVLIGLSFQKPSGVFLRRSVHSELAKKELIEYFEEGRKEFTCETAFIEGTDFEKIVWTALREIPYGETRTYKWLANKIGRPQAFRAVGNALGKNPIPIIFPCHRIIESDGAIGGYSSGIDTKRRLLELEYYTKLSMRSQDKQKGP